MNIFVYQKDGSAFHCDRDDFFWYLKNREKIATSELCSSCSIFDKEKQTCTHPSLGCEKNPHRTRPWEFEIICPIQEAKLLKSDQEAQKS